MMQYLCPAWCGAVPFLSEKVFFEKTSRKDSFAWTDDKVELLLRVTYLVTPGVSFCFVLFFFPSANGESNRASIGREERLSLLRKTVKQRANSVVGLSGICTAELFHLCVFVCVCAYLSSLLPLITFPPMLTAASPSVQGVTTYFLTAAVRQMQVKWRKTQEPHLIEWGQRQLHAWVCKSAQQVRRLL